ncbi:MAG: hypothetical protein AB1564_17070 [Chloroflexota bacterium]
MRLPFKINWRRVGVLIGIGVLALLVIDFNNRLEGLDRLTEQDGNKRAQATQVMQTQIALQTQVAYAGSDAAAEDYARGDGHSIQDGDIPVVPVGNPGSTPVVSSTPTPVPTQLPNWQKWWNLFFGE